EMIKAVFLDYTGTIIEEGGPDGMEMLRRCYKNSDIESMEAMLAYWWKLIKTFEAVSYKENYMTEDEIVDKALEECAAKIHLKEDFQDLHRLCQRFWA
ncbi:D-serine ammonia-lyase, partial [Clostridium sp. HCS.1]